MISVIFCSIQDARAEAIEAHYRSLLRDTPHEIIAIRDARSLSEAYNRGMDRAAGDIVIFSHDDIEFLEPPTWLARLTSHLNSFDLIGLAGTTQLVGPGWAQAGPPHTFGQVGELNKEVTPFRVLLCAVPMPVVPNIQAVDGLFIAVRRRVLERVRFDPVTFDGFHGYDLDFTFRAYQAGFRLAVAADIPVLHASQGGFDQTWRQYAERFVAKHAASLPRFRQRPFMHAVVGARSKEELLEIMRGPRAQWQLQEPGQRPQSDAELS